MKGQGFDLHESRRQMNNMDNQWCAQAWQTDVHVSLQCSCLQGSDHSDIRCKVMAVNHLHTRWCDTSLHWAKCFHCPLLPLPF